MFVCLVSVVSFLPTHTQPQADWNRTRADFAKFSKSFRYVQNTTRKGEYKSHVEVSAFITRRTWILQEFVFPHLCIHPIGIQSTDIFAFMEDFLLRAVSFPLPVRFWTRLIITGTLNYSSLIIAYLVIRSLFPSGFFWLIFPTWIIASCRNKRLASISPRNTSVMCKCQVNDWFKHDPKQGFCPELAYSSLQSQSHSAGEFRRKMMAFTGGNDENIGLTSKNDRHGGERMAAKQYCWLGSCFCVVVPRCS